MRIFNTSHSYGWNLAFGTDAERQKAWSGLCRLMRENQITLTQADRGWLVAKVREQQAIEEAAAG
jgi:hypothetical protein